LDAKAHNLLASAAQYREQGGGQQGAEPHVVLETPHVFVVHKPPGWEVDSREVGTGHRLSMYLQSLCSSVVNPIVHDPTHGFGMLHRIDTLVSGLVLVAKDFQAYYALQWQLSSGQVERDYISLWHGHVPFACIETHARLKYTKAMGNAPTLVSEHGKPASTMIKVLAHGSIGTHCFSLVALRIGTGRRHQIRAHAANLGHPVLCDSKYAASLAAEDRQICKRIFLHRYRLGFMDATGKSLEAVTDLPEDLRCALAKLQPLDAQSANALQEWVHSTGGDWERIESRSSCHA